MTLPPSLRPLARALAASAALAVATGCLVVRYSEGNQIRAERIAEIQPGVTRKVDVLNWFGAPQTFNDADMLRKLLDDSYTPPELMELPFQDVMAWQFNKGLVEGFTIGVYNRFDVRVASDRLVIFFDTNDVVLYYGYRRGTDAIPDEKKSDD